MSVSALPINQPRPNPRAVALAGALFAIALPACSHWAKQDLPTPQVVESRHPDRIRVTRRDGRQVVFLAPQVAGDSLVGTAEDATTGTRTARYGIPLADVREVAVRRVNVGATIALAAGDLRRQEDD